MTAKLLSIALVIAAVAGLLDGDVQAQEVRATVDRNRIRLDESILLTVTVTDAEAEVNPGPMDGFKVFSQGTSTSLRIVNGRTSRETAYRFTLLPEREGRLTIPALTVMVGEAARRTRPITVEVTRQAPTDASQRDVFVSARVSKSDPFMGEPIVFSLRLYHAVRIADAAVEALPAFEGFSAKPLENRDGFSEIVDGREYRVLELAFVLSPLTPGRHVLSEAMIRLDIYAPGDTSKRSALDRFFDDPFFAAGRRRTLRLRSEPIPVTVRSLPPDTPGATPFSGLVGRFSLESNLQNNRLAVGEAATLTVTLKGSGNLMDAAAPEIRIPVGLKTYADAPQEDIRATMEGYSGQKTFRIALVAVEPGTYDLAPIVIRTFDPADGRYHSLSSGIGSLTVSPSAGHESFTAASPAAPGDPAAAAPNRVEFTGRDILPIREDLDAVAHRGPMDLVTFVLLMGSPMLAFAAAWGWRRRTRPSDQPALVMVKRSRAAFSAARKGPADAFASELSRALRFAILARSGIRGESLTYREAVEALCAVGFDAEAASGAGALLERIDASRYGGRELNAEMRSALLRETEELIQKVMKS